MRLSGTIATCLVAGCLIFSANPSRAGQSGDDRTPARGSSASGPLDSRNIPHPEWTQVSGEVEQSRRTSGQGQAERLLVKLKAIEGGPVIVDLGDPARLHGLDFKERDYIHVRGEMKQSAGKQVLLAQELIAEGKVIAISREGLGHSAPDVNMFGGKSTGDGPPTPKSPAAAAPRQPKEASSDAQ